MAQNDSELEKQIKKCFTDTQMAHDEELELFDTDQTIKNISALFIAYKDKAVEEARADERLEARKLYAKRKPQRTKQWLADVLGISRPTLYKWLENPEMFTIGAVKKLVELRGEKLDER